jgi:hypothetical protein
MTVKAKTVLNDKFWIIEKDGVNVGTLSINDDKYMLSSSDGIKFFDNKRQLERNIGPTVFEIKEHIDLLPEKVVHGYSTSTAPFNPLYDVKRKLPLFTKSEKSKSLYCAGYYIIRFDKGWVKSFCPKLITVERYETHGPFKTDLEMKQELSRVNSNN